MTQRRRTCVDRAKTQRYRRERASERLYPSDYIRYPIPPPLPPSSLDCTQKESLMAKAISGVLRLFVHGVWQWSFLQDPQILHVLQEGFVMLGDQKRVHSLHVLLKLLHVPLELRPPVLEPRDHLSVAQTELCGDLVPVGRAQVFLIEKSFLQLEDLLIRERGPTLALLLRLLAVVEQVQVISLLCNKQNARIRLIVHSLLLSEERVSNIAHARRT